MRPTGFPVLLVLAGRRCLVVGGGRVALQKVLGLLAAGALVTVVAPEVDDEIAALDVTVERRTYRPADLEKAWIAIAATGVGEVDGTVFRDGERAGVLVNAADDPEHCAFTLPAVARRGPVSVAVATDGTSPAVASWLRDRLAAALPDRLEEVVGAVIEARRRVRATGRASEGLSWGTLLDQLTDGVEAGGENLESIVDAFVAGTIDEGADVTEDRGATFNA